MPNKTYAGATQSGSPPRAIGRTDKRKNKVDDDGSVDGTPQGSVKVGEQSGNVETAKYIAKGKKLTDEYVKSTLGHLQPPPVTSLGKKVSMLTIDRDIFARRIARLRDRGMIINTVDFNPLREAMLKWVTANFI